MKKMFIKKNSIAYYTIKLIEVLLLFIAIVTMCIECDEVLKNLIIKGITTISIIAISILEKIKVK